MNCPEMVVGVDLDNTIVSYDSLFHRLALEQGLIPSSFPASKTEIRDHLRRVGKENAWTGLQGLAYGTRMNEAEFFPGVTDFFSECIRRKTRVHIISHRTRQPFLGPPCDLHDAALRWLKQGGFGEWVSRGAVFLELTREAKLGRIMTTGCTHFVDDLPEFLSAVDFPASVQRLLFDPCMLHGAEIRFPRMESWAAIHNKLFL